MFEGNERMFFFIYVLFHVIIKIWLTFYRVSSLLNFMLFIEVPVQPIKIIKKKSFKIKILNKNVLTALYYNFQPLTSYFLNQIPPK